MVKALLVSLLLSLSLQLGAQSINLLPDHDTFVHLPANEQKRIIVGVMEFMVSMEAQFEKSVLNSKSDIPSHIREKMFSHLRFIQNVLMTSAHAQDLDQDPFKNYRKRYAESLDLADKQTKNIVCIYAGWISSIGANKKCMHPRLSPISKYPTKEQLKKFNKKPLGDNDIVCNPLMFGFGTPKSGELLVAVATTSSINSSLDCMNQSQGVSRDGKNSDEDDNITKARLDQLKAAYLDKSHEATYLRLTKMIHQVCLCPEAPKNMYADYLKAIRPHRTCFGLLNQYKYLRTNECSAGPETLGLNIDTLTNIVDVNLSKMQEKVNGLVIKHKLSEQDVKDLKAVDASFETLLKDDAQSKKFCEAQPKGKQVCKIKSCTKINGLDADCSATIDGSQDPTKLRPVIIKNGTGEVTSVASQSNDKEKVTCALPEMKCNVGKCDSGKCAISVSNATIADPAKSSIEFGTEKSKSIEVIPTGLDDKSKFAVTCLAPDADPICEVSKCSTDKTTKERSCDFTIIGPALKDPNQKSFKVPKDYAEKDFPIELEGEKSVRCLIKEDDKTSTCEMTIVPSKDGKTADISVLLTMLDGDEIVTPTISSDIALQPAKDNKNLYTANVALDKISNIPLTAKGFSKKSPEANCEKRYPEAPKEPSISVTAGTRTKNSAGIYIIIVTAVINDNTDLDKNDIEWTGGDKTPADAPEKREVVDSETEQKVCATHKRIKNQKDEKNCVKIPPKGPVKATLSLAGKNRANQNFDVKATVTLEGKVFDPILSDGYTLVWFEKGKPELTDEEKALKDKKDADAKEAARKLKEKLKKDEPKGSSNDSKTEDDPKTKDVTTPDVKSVDGEVQNGTSLLYPAPIGTAPYEICANLMKNGKVEGTGCKTVPGYKAPVPQQMGPPPVPGAYRYRRW